MKEQDLELYGWDDGKIYFMSESGEQFCVNDYEELLLALKRLCRDFFEKLSQQNLSDNYSE